MVDIDKTSPIPKFKSFMMWMVFIFLILCSIAFMVRVLKYIQTPPCENLQIGIAREQKDGTYEMEIVEVCHLSEVEKYLNHK